MLGKLTCLAENFGMKFLRNLVAKILCSLLKNKNSTFRVNFAARNFFIYFPLQPISIPTSFNFTRQCILQSYIIFLIHTQKKKRNTAHEQINKMEKENLVDILGLAEEKCRRLRNYCKLQTFLGVRWAWRKTIGHKMMSCGEKEKFSSIKWLRSACVCVCVFVQLNVIIGMAHRESK